METKIVKVPIRKTGKIIWNSQRSETDNIKRNNTEKLEVIDAEISISKWTFMNLNLILVVHKNILVM